jgi:hypothetical protein
MVPRLLREAGWPAEAHDDHFAPDTKDPDLLRALGDRDWVLLTQDSRIRYRTPERDEYLAAGLKVFVVSSGNLKGEETAAILLGARTKVERMCEAQAGPFVVSVHKNSTLQKLD